MIIDFSIFNWWAIGVTTLFNILLTATMFGLWKPLFANKDDEGQVASKVRDKLIAVSLYSFLISFVVWEFYAEYPETIPDFIRPLNSTIILVLMMSHLVFGNVRKTLGREMIFFFLSLWGTTFLFRAFF